MKSVASTLMVIVASFSILLVTGCDSIQDAIYRSAIEKAIHEDALTGHEPTADHVNAMRQVDLSNCPPDFREAYSRHIRAWEEAAEVQQAWAKLANDEDTAAVAGILATVFDSDATPWSDHVLAVQKVNRLEAQSKGDIQTSWQQVEDVARKYGVQM